MTPSSPTQVPPTDETTMPEGATSNNPGGALRGGANMYGSFSIESFCSAGALTYTHDDADGFMNYVSRFTAPNFRYKDSGVKIWAYYETYDNWQDTYGMDAVCVAYHVGHGGMDGNGVFYVPMGAAWAGNDCTAVSSSMRLGNEYARYVFWSTCESLRVLGGHSPIRTWNVANLGWRMLFGFETVSWDNPNYGKFFWEEWNKNKSFSTAWLDASWRIAHDQAPSVVACGANQAEARDRLYNERFFNRGAASRNWWEWRWYFASSVSRQPLLTVPDTALVAQLRPVEVQASSVRQFADRFEVDMPSGEATRTSGGGFTASSGETSISYGADGALDVQLAKPNLDNQQQLAGDEASAIAQAAVSQYGLAESTSLVPDRVLLAYGAGGSSEGSGTVEEPRVTGTTVQFRQMVAGIPVIGDAGVVRVTVDNDGTVTNVHSSLRRVESLNERRGDQQPTPPGTSMSAAEEPSPEPGSYEQGLAAEFGKLLGRWASSDNAPVAFTTVPDTTEIGYEVRGTDAVLVARKAIEVDFGRGYRKRYWLTTPLA